MDTRNTPTDLTGGSNIPEKTAPHVAERVEELNTADREAAAKRRIAELTGELTPDTSPDPEAAIEEEVTRERFDPAAHEDDDTPLPGEPRYTEQRDAAPDAPGSVPGTTEYVRDGGRPIGVTFEERLDEEPGDREWTDAGTTDTPDVEDEQGPADPWAAMWHDVLAGPAHVFEVPDGDTSPAQYARRLEALQAAEDTIGSASGSFGSPIAGGGSYVSRPIVDIVYVAEWLLDRTTPVHLPGACAGREEPTDG